MGSSTRGNNIFNVFSLFFFLFICEYQAQCSEVGMNTRRPYRKFPVQKSVFFNGSEALSDPRNFVGRLRLAQNLAVENGTTRIA
jgi:hypothetical protein